jgi:hypothetical protein
VQIDREIQRDGHIGVEERRRDSHTGTGLYLGLVYDSNRPLTSSFHIN